MWRPVYKRVLAWMGPALLAAVMIASPSPQSAPSLETANSLYAAGKFKDAADLLTSLTVVQPPVEEVHIQLIKVQLRMNDLKGAQQTAEQALQMFPKSAPIATGLGDVHYRMSRFSQAALLYGRALQYDPENAHALLGLGRISQMASMRKSAREYFEVAHARAPDDPEILLAWAYSRPDSSAIAAGLETYLRVARFQPQDWLDGIQRDITFKKYLGERSECRPVGPPSVQNFKLSQMAGPGDRDETLGIEIAMVGAKPVKALLSHDDTIVATAGYARQMQLPKVLDTPIEDPFGNRRKDYIAFAESIRIGSREFQNCRVRVVDGTSVYVGGHGPQVSVGLGLFEDSVAVVDFKKHSLTLSPAPGVAGDNRDFDAVTPDSERDFTRLPRSGPIFLVLTQLNRGPERFFALSFGLSRSQISFYTKEGQDISPYALQELKFDRFTVRTYVSREIYDVVNYLNGFELGGALGYDALNKRVVKLDYRNGLVKFE